jgi:hypothetical protein
VVLAVILPIVQAKAQVPDENEVPPSREATLNYFYDSLAPSGRWITTSRNGEVWQPDVATTVPNWRPYWTAGRWVYTDSGWYWYSDYPWGWAVFHYGRWRLDPELGWVWQPDHVWAPSWVFWRHGEKHMGWAPLPPRVHFEKNTLFDGKRPVAADSDYRMEAKLFTFVRYDNFWDHDVWRHGLQREELEEAFRSSKALNNLSMRDGKVINESLPHERMTELTHHAMDPLPLRSTPAMGNGILGAQGQNKYLTVFRPTPVEIKLPKDNPHLPYPTAEKPVPGRTLQQRLDNAGNQVAQQGKTNLARFGAGENERAKQLQNNLKTNALGSKTVAIETPALNVPTGSNLTPNLNNSRRPVKVPAKKIVIP